MFDKDLEEVATNLEAKADEIYRRRLNSIPENHDYPVNTPAAVTRLRLSAELLRNGVTNFYWDKGYAVICDKILMSPSRKFRFRKTSKVKSGNIDYDWRVIYSFEKWVEKFVKPWCPEYAEMPDKPWDHTGEVVWEPHYEIGNLCKLL